MATYIVIFLIGVCIGGLVISLFSSDAYDRGFDDARQIYKDLYKHIGGGKVGEK